MNMKRNNTITKEEVQKVLQKSANKTLKNDGVHIEIVFEKQAEALLELLGSRK